MIKSEALHTPSKRIDDYVLTSQKIGKGSFGSVFIGYDAQGQKLAVKVVNRTRLTGDDTKYLVNEVAALQHCRNDHIVKLLDLKKTRNNFYLFLQYCEGGDLYSHVTKRGRLPEREALCFFYQILRAFRTIVRLELIHRDLKPENIFLKDGKVKIGDFGLSKQLAHQQVATTYAGSPLNMAPEVLQHLPYDNRADIYSMGTVLHFMLYGQLPFIADSRTELVNSIAMGSLRLPKEVKVSAETRSLLRQMLQREPEDRISWDELFLLEGKTEEKRSAQQFQDYEQAIRKIKLTWMGVLPVFCDILMLGPPAQKVTAVKQMDTMLAAGFLCELLRDSQSAQTAG